MSLSNPPPLFITFEGADGSGKTTQSRILADRINALWTREPGGTSLGTSIRELCLGPDHNPCALAELLLMAADRAQHIAEVIRPALLNATSVVCDRFTHSTIAYQGAGRMLDTSLIQSVCDIAASSLVPDAVVVINVDPATAESRYTTRSNPDRLEQTSSDFKERVRLSFLAQASGDQSMLVVDGSGDVNEVATRVWDALTTFLGERLPSAG